MAAAVARTCVVCEAASSKYKCPSCSSPTCSLACSKAHKALRHEAASEGVATSANGKGTRQEAPAPVIRANGQEIQPPPSGYAATTSYVPLSSYDDRQLLKDFEYLQHVGRSVQEVGRELTKQQWFSPDMVTGQTPDPRTSQQQQSQQQGYLGKGKGREAHHHQQQLSVGQRRRQALDSTIRRGRWPIMLLPEGMQMRRENRTQWKNGKMAFTVEVRSCQLSSERASRWRTLLHQINGEERVHDVVLDQLVKRTKNLLPKKARKAGASNEARYMISDAAWQQAGFSPPNNKGTKSSNDEDDNREPKPYDALPAWCEIVVAVHSDRLRNETSAKFLGWWKRQVKNGLVGPDGLELVKPKEEDGEGAEIDFSEASIAIPTAPRSERGGDGGNSNVGAQIERKAEEAGVPVPAGLGSLLSSGLLSRLHEQMNKGNKKPAEASTDTPADGAAIDRPSKEELSKIMSRTIVVAADETQTIEGLVREVGSRGLAIVEYPCLELWDAKSLRKDVAKKGTEVVELASNDLKRKRKRIDEEISDDEDASAAPRHPAAKRQLPAPAKPVGIIGLSAYDSSDEGSAEDEKEGIARNREDTTREEEGDVDAGDTASIARAVGWIPAEPRGNAKVKDSLVQEVKDGEELDWGDDD